MGVQDLPEDDDELEGRRDLTVGELVDIYGKEAVRRGLEYMESLQEADQEFRKSANPEDLSEGLEEAFDVENIEDPDSSERWAESVKEDGLGLDNEE